MQYANLDGFRTYFNGIVQALRNVTFMIQSAKHSIDDFDRWYTSWQNSLKSDTLMKWAVDKRNKVAKSGDLEADSSALISLHGAVNARPLITANAPPSTSNRELAAILMRRIKASDSLIEHGVIRIERRWVDRDLPTHEVLEAASHAFARLAGLISDCHRHIGHPEISPWRHFTHIAQQSIPTEFQGLLPPCMIAFQDALTSWVRTADGSEISISGRDIDTDLRSLKAASDRYGVGPRNTLISALTAKSLKERAFLLCESAIPLMEKDGHHIPMAWLFRHGQYVWSGVFEIPDNATKHLIWSKLREHVLRHDADEVLFVSELWMGEFDSKEPERRPGDMTNRSEWLGVDGIKKSGEEIGVIAKVTRDGSKTVVGEPSQIEGLRSFYFDDIREAWGLKRSESRAFDVDTSPQPKGDYQ